MSDYEQTKRNEKLLEQENIRAREKFLEKQAALIQDYRKTFTSDSGQKVLADLMANNFVYQTTFASTPIEMALREGGRSLVMQILAKLDADPEKIRSLIKEGIDAN